MKKDNHRPLPAGFRLGAVSLAFLILGYQVALFVHRSASLKVVADRDRPDTVYVYLAEGRTADVGAESPDAVRREGLAGAARVPDTLAVRRAGRHSPAAENAYAASPLRKVESFRFNPNTVSVNDLQRLGFSVKQAAAIDNYRAKGGRFRRKEDFARSFVVADSVYRRLEPFIDIPKIDINRADSAAFDSLPGIGGYFAAKMVQYRSRLGGYSCKEQLMEIYHFDREKFDGLSDLIVCSEAPPYPLWSLPADSLRLHPYVRDWQTAKAIVFYREHNPPGKLTVDGLEEAGVIDAESAAKLRRCRLE